jgi:CHASE3 domain sensor protein
MDIGSIFLILALLLLVIVFISRPLFDRNQQIAANGEEQHELSHLLAERDRILNALQELDFDHVLGKIPDEDYPSQRAFLLQRGAQVLRSLDEIRAQDSSQDLEARIEAAIATRRADAAARKAVEPEPVLAVAGTSVDDELELMLSNRRRARQEKAAGFCSQCGGPVQKSDRFCPKCGSSLA